MSFHFFGIKCVVNTDSYPFFLWELLFKQMLVHKERVQCATTVVMCSVRGQYYSITPLVLLPKGC